MDMNLFSILQEGLRHEGIIWPISALSDGVLPSYRHLRAATGSLRVGTRIEVALRAVSPDLVP